MGGGSGLGGSGGRGGNGRRLMATGGSGGSGDQPKGLWGAYLNLLEAQPVRSNLRFAGAVH